MNGFFVKLVCEMSDESKVIYYKIMKTLFQASSAHSKSIKKLTSVNT